MDKGANAAEVWITPLVNKREPIAT